MILFLRIMAWLLVLVALCAVLVMFGPRSPVDRDISFAPETLPDDLDAYLAAEEAKVADLRPDVARRIHWIGESGTKTPLSVVYLHGFSATSGEVQPVVDHVAEALGANIHFARLAGHGRSGAAMAEPEAGDWIEDTAEALAIGRRIGDRVLVIATSTGATLAALAATEPDLSEDLAGLVLVSANFQLNRPEQFLLTWPWADRWLPLIAGQTRRFEPLNEAHAAYWTTEYPTVALVPMGALVAHVRGLDFSKVVVPALFVYSEEDRVVLPRAIEDVHAAWGGPKAIVTMTMGPNDDEYHHVIAGDALSPGQTERAVREILDWATGLTP